MGECGLETPALLEELAGAGSEMPACRGRPVGTWQGTLALGGSQGLSAVVAQAEVQAGKGAH